MSISQWAKILWIKRSAEERQYNNGDSKGYGWVMDSFTIDDEELEKRKDKNGNK